MRISIIALVAAFAAGITIRVADASAMALHIATAAGGDVNMGGCKNCPDDGHGDSGSGCADICAMPAMLAPDVTEIVFLIVAHEPASFADRTVIGRTRPPEPHPPQSIILS